MIGTLARPARLDGPGSVALRLCASRPRAADTTKIVLIAGNPSHGPGDHEFNAGCKLLAKCLSQVPGVEPVVVTGGWPEGRVGLRRRQARSSSSWTAAADTR